MTQTPLVVHCWGEVEYESSVCRQLEIVGIVKSTKRDHLVFCTHPPLVTLGRSSTSEDMKGWEGPVFESRRGGRATYHGPGQVVIYPIIDLCQKRHGLCSKDIHKYLRFLERWLVHSLREFSIEAQVGTEKGGVGERRVGERQGPSMTGVWVGAKKIASVGVAVKSWVTYHGVALNVTKEDQAFQGIRPCGFQSDVMVSMEEVLGREVDRVTLVHVLKDHFERDLASTL